MSDVFHGTSASAIPPRINAPPAHWVSESRSPTTSHEAAAANNGSKQKISAARAADMWRWAAACSTNDSVLAKTTVQASAAAKAGVQSIRGRSNSAAATAATRAVPAICIHTDRKSTRLNSSHLVISYAVFCLKKKNDDEKHAAAVAWE